MRPFKLTPGGAIAVLVLFFGGVALAAPVGPITDYVASGSVSIGPEETKSASCPTANASQTEYIISCEYTNAQLIPYAGSFGAGQVYIYGGNDPKVVAEATTSGGAQGAGAGGTLDYYFEVVPNGVSTFPLIVDALFTGGFYNTPYVNDGQGDVSLASALVQLYDPDGNPLFSKQVDNYGPQGPDVDNLFLENIPLNIFDPYEVVLTASAGTFSLGVSESAEAIVDPTLTLDPAYADEFTIIYSPGLLAGVSAVPGVPEPTSTAMMILGLAGVGIARRRRCGPASPIRPAVRADLVIDTAEPPFAAMASDRREATTRACPA